MLAEKQSYRVQSYTNAVPNSAPQKDQRAHAGERRQYSITNRISMLLCIGICAGIAWFIATTSAKINALNYDVYRLQTQIQKAAATNADLMAQVDKLSQPARIMEIAKNRLHMTYANPVQIGSSSSELGQ
jgi:cell division protein FtsL